MDVIYYEAHITIEPTFDQKLDLFKVICEDYGFKVAELLMKKRKDDTLERSSLDSFCTGRSKSYDDLNSRMMNLVEKLQPHFKVWRYKLEATLLDVRLK